VGADEIKVIKKGTPHHFVSCKTGHPAVAGLRPFDFFMWFNENEGCIDHISATYLEAEGLTPILLTGMGIWYSPRRELDAAAERQAGKGFAIFDQTRAASLMQGEPRAEIYLEKLLERICE